MKEYLKETETGIQITLANQADVGGAKVGVLHMREPTVRDLEAAQKSTGDDAASEIQLFANLMEISADDVRGLKLRNWQRVQEAYKVFTA